MPIVSGSRYNNDSSLDHSLEQIVKGVVDQNGSISEAHVCHGDSICVSNDVIHRAEDVGPGTVRRRGDGLIVPDAHTRSHTNDSKATIYGGDYPCNQCPVAVFIIGVIAERTKPVIRGR